MSERTIAVTGSASGIGAALTNLLQKQGDRVIGIDLRDADVIADLSTHDGRLAAAAAVTEAAGGVLDGVVTCAGTSLPGVLMVRVNYFGTTELVAALQPALAASDAPRVAVVGSISGTQQADDATVAACLAGDEAGAVQAAEEVLATAARTSSTRRRSSRWPSGHGARRSSRGGRTRGSRSTWSHRESCSRR